MARRTWAEMMLGKYVVFIGRHYAGDEQYVVIARISAKLEYDCSAVQWPACGQRPGRGRKLTRRCHHRSHSRPDVLRGVGPHSIGGSG